MVTMTAIECTICKVEKNVSEFYVSKRHKLGYIPTCKICESSRHKKKYDPDKRRKHYEENKEVYLERSKSYNERNKEKVKQKTKMYYENNKIKFLESGWKRKGILNNKSLPFTKEDFDSLFLLANFSCQICKTTKPIHKKGFVVDHCHKTGFARGILCAHCNAALGSFKDDIQILKSAIDYLTNDEQLCSQNGG
jgi:hypothetical protein